MFTEAWNNKCGNFLDLKLKGDREKETAQYRKRLAENMILKANSCHSQHTILAILRGKYTRSKQECSRNEDYVHEVQKN